MKMTYTAGLDIYKLKLHESAIIGNKDSVMRVAIGWIYSTYHEQSGLSRIFVPFDNKFQII